MRDLAVMTFKITKFHLCWYESMTIWI